MAGARKLLIVAHAPSPNTETLRNAVAEGARHPDIENVEVRVLPPLEAGPDDVLACDAIILGTTENLGYMSGALKDFLTAVITPVWRRLRACLLRSTSGPDMTAPEPDALSNPSPPGCAGVCSKSR